MTEVLCLCPYLITTFDHFFTSKSNRLPKHFLGPPPKMESSSPPHNRPSASTSSPPMPTSTSTSSLMGKHRMAAAISNLNQQIQIIQEELDLLETIGGASTVCEELISTIESLPDALLPETRSPVDVGWDRWFQGAQSSRSRRRWI